MIKIYFMEFIIKATNIELTQELENFLKEKISDCEKFIHNKKFPLIAKCEIEKITSHHRKGPVFRAEVNVELPGRKFLRAEAVKEEIHVAIIETRDRFQREIKKYVRKK